MGQLFYGNTSEPIEFPDRLLAHVRVVTTTKLRRSESFTLSWRFKTSAGTGMSTLWIQPSIPLRFVFDREPDATDPAILHDFAQGANSSRGLVVDFDQFYEEGGPIPIERAA